MAAADRELCRGDQQGTTLLATPSFRRWNKERLLEAYTTDPDGVVAAAGLRHFGAQGAPAAPFDCSVCLDSFPPEKGFQLGCKCVAAGGGERAVHLASFCSEVCVAVDATPHTTVT